MMLTAVISLLTHFLAEVCLATGSESHLSVPMWQLSFQKKNYTSICVCVSAHAHVRVFLGIVNAEQVNQHISMGSSAVVKFEHDVHNIRSCSPNMHTLEH